MIPYGPEGGIKNTIRSPRAEGEARGLRDGIFDTTQVPIWYYYYLIVYFMKNICKNSFNIKWRPVMTLKILAIQNRAKITFTLPKISSK